MGSFFKITLGMAAATVATVGAGTALIVACSSDPVVSNSPGTTNTPGVPCTTAPGDIPVATCDDSTNACTGGGCAIDEAKCGSTSTCKPLGENKGKDVWDLRLRKLNVVAPPGLAEALIQNVVVGRNINLNAPECGEVGGTGSFSWLMRIDTKNKIMTTGGAPPSTDPFGLGYCFANDITANGVKFGPATMPITIDGNKITPSGNFPKLNIPIYIDGDPNNIILLPISNGNFRDVTVSEGGDCIGSFNTKALNNTCDELRGTCATWKTAGALGGYITLEEADTVVLKDLENRTLCGYLTGNTQQKGCARVNGATGAITAKGDYCSTTNSAGGCQDSYWLAATFAASAIKIHDGASIKQCNGGGAAAGDAGAD